ncbi:MAG TPA: DUF4153 domain-containing protein [Bacillota bacterium]|nr:DUF4153 domain-containing protein [Bacillota bacterium]
MNGFTGPIKQVFKGAIKAFQTFPVSIACALAFAAVTIIRIQLDWPQQEPLNFLFNCLHWAFAVGALFSLAIITGAQSRFNDARAFLISNLLGAGAAMLTFLLMYFFGGTDPAIEGSRYAMVSSLAAARAGAAIFVSFLAFIMLAGYPKEQSDFARSFFMTHKAFFIALLYGLVIMGGASGVAGAVQALLYRSMSGKVYMYIGTLTGFLAYTIFVGYFPDFRKGQIDEKREAAQKQPRFVEILFGYIMIPIVLTLTAVLLIWSGKTILSGMRAPFLRLSAIATAYSAGGIWLHIMLTHHESWPARLYRWIFPVAALVILAFEAWALVIQLQKYGLKITEYSFTLTWIVTVAAAVLLFLLKSKAHTVIALITCFTAVFSVLPVFGYHALPMTAQISRLEKLLISQGMLKGDKLVPSAAEPELSVRESITDAVIYIADSRDAKLPAWFDKDLRRYETFKERLGFEQTWPVPETIDQEGPGGYMGTSLYLKSSTVDIRGYQWAVSPQESYVKGNKELAVDGKRGTYKIYWDMNPPSGIPSLRIMLNEKVILEKDMNEYIDRITSRYPPGGEGSREADIEDMSFVLESPEVTVMLVFNNINININPREDIINYWMNLHSIYMKEKP